LLRRLGFEPSIVDGGCCGLAGSFGFSADHEALSRRIGEEQWLPALRAAASAADHVVIDGFSCLMQHDHLEPELPTSTLLALVRRALTDDAER
jgi:Fe-S oxidoreductase